MDRRTLDLGRRADKHQARLFHWLLVWVPSKLVVVLLVPLQNHQKRGNLKTASTQTTKKRGGNLKNKTRPVCSEARAGGLHLSAHRAGRSLNRRRVVVSCFFGFEHVQVSGHLLVVWIGLGFEPPAGCGDGKIAKPPIQPVQVLYNNSASID